MDDDSATGDGKPLTVNSTAAISNDISINLASLLKNLSQNSVSIADTPITSIAELNLDIDNFNVQNVHRNGKSGGIMTAAPCDAM